MPTTQDNEIQLYHDLMEVPDRFEEGFGAKTVVGALFLGVAMLPGSIYLALVMGARFLVTYRACGSRPRRATS